MSKCMHFLAVIETKIMLYIFNDIRIKVRA